ncbi:MAG: cytoplasmic protein [Tuberibacillus sp.]
MEKHDVTINGSGMTSGGEFGKVVIRGEGSVTSDIQCREFICRGSSKALGEVKADEMKIAGQSLFKANVDVRTISIFGQGEFQENVHAQEMKIWGNADVYGNLKCDDVKVTGKVSVTGDIEAETFFAKGAFKVKGLLNAGTIHISIKNYVGQSEAKEIGGEKIIVKRKNSVLGLFNKHNLLLAEIIEGDDIYLEYTNAKVVRGTNVKIGPGCDIEKVEYKNDFYASHDAVVREKQQV